MTDIQTTRKVLLVDPDGNGIIPYVGTVDNATADADGNVITETYATKDELAEAVADGVPDTIDCGTITE